MATPQPPKTSLDHISGSLQSSAPLPKRKKLAEQIAEFALSDAEFEEDEVSEVDITSSDQIGGSEVSNPLSTSQSDHNMSIDTTDLTSSAADGTPESNVSAMVAMPKRWGLCNVCHCVTRVTTKGKIFKHGPGCDGSMQAPVDGSVSDIKAKCADAGLAVDAKVKAERDERTVFIKNLSKKVKENDLRKNLRLDILDIRLKKTKSKKYRGKKFAFVQFADVASAKLAHDTMQGKTHGGRLLSVMYAKTTAKKVLQQQQQQQKTATAGATSAPSDVGAGSSGCDDSRSENENSSDKAGTSHDDDYDAGGDDDEDDDGDDEEDDEDDGNDDDGDDDVDDEDDDGDDEEDDEDDGNDDDGDDDVDDEDDDGNDGSDDDDDD